MGLRRLGFWVTMVLAGTLKVTRARQVAFLVLSRLPSNLGLKKGALFCLKGLIREPAPPKKGIRVLLGILVVVTQIRILGQDLLRSTS